MKGIAKSEILLSYSKTGVADISKNTDDLNHLKVAVTHALAHPPPPSSPKPPVDDSSSNNNKNSSSVPPLSPPQANHPKSDDVADLPSSNNYTSPTTTTSNNKSSSSSSSSSHLGNLVITREDVESTSKLQKKIFEIYDCGGFFFFCIIAITSII